MPKADASSYYVNKNSIHSQNEWQYIVGDRLLNLFQFDVSFDHNRKYDQFVTIYHIPVHGYPIMFNFETSRLYFKCSKWNFFHRNDGLICWLKALQMLCMECYWLPQKLHLLLLLPLPFLIKYDVTTIDNTQWLSIQLYVVQAWKRIPNLFVLR